jgi:inosose dehydratase
VDDNGTGPHRELLARVAGGPISWGICEVPGWGLQLPVDRVLDEMRDAGLGATELGAIGWLPTEPAALRATLDAHDLRAVAAFVPIVGHDPARRAASMQTADEMASLLEAVGARHFVTALVNDPDDWSRPALDDAQWEHMIDVVDEIDDLTASHGVQQVVHPHVNTLVETADELERFLESSDVPFCLDTGHVTLGGSDPLDLAKRCADRVALVHLKDVRSDVAARLGSGELPLMAAVQAGLFAPLGDGDVLVAETIVELERQGYDGLYVLEQDVAITGAEPAPGDGPVRDVLKSVAYLRSLEPTLRALAGGGNASTGSTTTDHQRGTDP